MTLTLEHYCTTLMEKIILIHNLDGDLTCCCTSSSKYLWRQWSESEWMDEGWLHSADCLFLLIGLPGLGKDSAIKKKQEKNAHAL